MTTPLVVFGAGGHGKVVADILLARGDVIAGFIDDGVASGSIVMGLPVLGSSSWLAANTARVALGIGDNAARARVADKCLASGAELVAAIHPRAVVARSSTVAAGAAVMALAVINPDTKIEEGAIVNTAAVVEHDCVVGRFAHVAPNSVLGGGAHVGELTLLGIGSVMLPLTRVGARSVVGGGSVVVKDIPSNVVARGSPARVTR